jgi:hypothetical protein
MFGFLAWLAARRTERKIENLRVVPIQRVFAGASIDQPTHRRVRADVGAHRTHSRSTRALTLYVESTRPVVRTRPHAPIVAFWAKTDSLAWIVLGLDHCQALFSPHRPTIGLGRSLVRARLTPYLDFQGSREQPKWQVRTPALLDGLPFAINDSGPIVNRLPPPAEQARPGCVHTRGRQPPPPANRAAAFVVGLRGREMVGDGANAYRTR